MAAQPSIWAAGMLGAQAAMVAVWIPAFAFDPLGTAVDQDVVSIVLLMAVFVGPIAWGSGVIAGRTGDERLRFRWLLGLGLIAAVTSWLVVSFAGDLFSCGESAVRAPSGRVSCSSSLLERVSGIVMAEAAILGQWIVARREWFLRLDLPSGRGTGANSRP